MEGTTAKVVVSRRALDALAHHVRILLQAVEKQPSPTVGGAGWLIGSADEGRSEVINCIACTEFTDKGGSGATLVQDLATAAPQWDEEVRFLASALPRGGPTAAVGLYLCLLPTTAQAEGEAAVEQALTFIAKHAAALREVSAFGAQARAVVVAIQSLHEDGQAAPAFFRTNLKNGEIKLERVQVEEAKPNQVLRDYGLFRARLQVPLHLTRLGDVDSTIASIEAQIAGDDVHFLFPTEKSGQLVNRSSSAVLPAKEYQNRAKGESDVPVAIEVKIYTSRSGKGSRSTVNAPVLHFNPSSSNQSSTTIHYALELDSLAYISLAQATKLSEVLDHLIEGFKLQLRQMVAFIRQLGSSTQFNKLHAYHFSPLDIPHIVTLIYPTGQYGWEDNLGSLRQRLHKKLLLPLDRPLLKSSNSLLLEPTTAPEEGASVHLRDVHKTLGPSGAGGRVHLVDGSYEYYHYMQDKFDDRGWGCAYRSMQTICSWVRIQGYTQLPVPTHREIQQMLVDMKDKPSSFVGSREWIGAIEIQMCLDKLYGLSCKILRVGSGAELAFKGAELAHHFDTQGTPVMIGGGVLAYTLLGVDYNEDTGAIKFLILDPHYTGADIVKSITKEKWCAWRDASLFRKDSFYNLCMPQRPREI